jgi:hypothetical protein
MHTGSKEPPAVDGKGLERAIVLQLLRDDHERKWSLEQLVGVLEEDRSEASKEAVEEVLQRLTGEGVLCRSEDAVWASDAALRLDELELISV